MPVSKGFAGFGLVQAVVLLLGAGATAEAGCDVPRRVLGPSLTEPPDARYRPGRDVRGRAVPPADLPAGWGDWSPEDLEIVIPVRPPGGPRRLRLELTPGPGLVSE